MLKRVLIPVILITAVWVPLASAHVGSHASIHDTVAGFLERIKHALSHEELVALTAERAEKLLTEEEKSALATDYLVFRVDTPVILSIVRDARLKDEPFWLNKREFKLTDLEVTVGTRRFDVWEKRFDAGEIGLGVNSLSGGGEHYFVAIKSQDGKTPVHITDIYPGQHTVDVMRQGQTIYVDRDTRITSLPAQLDGQSLLRGANDRRDEGRIVNLFRITPYPATDRPDHVVLTWNNDPKTTQTIQWRTSTQVKTGVVSFQKKSTYHSFQKSEPSRVNAQTFPLVTPTIVNDPEVNRHTAVVTGLDPGTTYVFAVGDGNDDTWSELSEFTTAPVGIEPFSFIYMGDAQNGLERWGTLVQNAYRERPDAAFYVMAGDLVNRGAERDDWDSLFQNAQGVFDRRQLVPVLGNHEYQGGAPDLYLKQFALLENGPKTIDPEKAYSFEYSNALFVVLDSNLPSETQSDWLEQQLSSSQSTWKFVVYHHPAYASGIDRDNPEIRSQWGAIFDKYHVDLALQGHDHAYLRTYPMKDGKRMTSAAEGTIYIVSVSGTKYYEQGEFDYTEFGMTNVSTFQILDIQISGNRLVYKSFDIDGKLRDEFVIEK